MTKERRRARFLNRKKRDGKEKNDAEKERDRG